MAAHWVRYSCMVFGIANIIGGIIYSIQGNIFALVGGLLVGGAWFAFGKYGGLPLVDTVANWRPAARPNLVDEMHRRGLLVMRQRRWMMWAAIPGALAAAALLMPPLMGSGHPELIIFLLGVPLAIITFRYALSRCPRCGYGFFAGSASRAALLRLRNTCGHCGLSLRAYKRS